KTGLPRHLIVTLWPSATGASSNSIDESARTEASGFIWSTKGHATKAVPTTPAAPVAIYRKSRRFGSACSAVDTGQVPLAKGQSTDTRATSGRAHELVFLASGFRNV